ncbi:MAG: UvrD-helicase domain-containing protein [Bacteroidales bacterium]
MKENFLEELNEAQRQAVENITGPSLIIAGAGSGKTKVLTCRIAYLLQHGIPASSILALTFTNKAAKEMKDRLAAMVEPDLVRFLWMGTFHSVFSRILRTEAEVLGFPRNFTIYDKADTKAAIKKCIKELQLDEKTYPPGEAVSRISRAKNSFLTAEGYRNNPRVQEADQAMRKSRMVDIYDLYAKRCKLSGAMDFDDLLLYTNKLLQQYPEVLERYRDRFRYILVDEYQDTNLVQYQIIKNLALVHRNLTVVGDDSQSIYAFRGARIENILNFSKDFPEAAEFRLEQNYRSTQTVVKAANSLISHNKRRLRKECFSEAAQGEKIELIRTYTDKEEAFMVVGSVVNKQYATSDGFGAFAIFYRTNAQSRLFEEALRRRNIPYKVYGGFSFYERAEVKTLLAYMRLVVNPNDQEAFIRAVGTPARGIGTVSLQKLNTAAAFAEMSSLRYILEGDLAAAGLKGNIAGRMKAFADILEAVRNLQEEGKNAFELTMELAQMSGYLAHLKEDKSIEGMSRLANVEELFNSLKSFCEEAVQDVELETEVAAPEPGEGKPTLERFLNNVTLLTQADEDDTPDKEKVSLMTVHSAKGLEFSHVYVTGMEEKLFPLLMTSNTIEEELEEERRLFYVAMTRAKKTLTLSYSQTRMRWANIENNRPSRFLQEINPVFLARSLPDDAGFSSSGSFDRGSLDSGGFGTRSFSSTSARSFGRTDARSSGSRTDARSSGSRTDARSSGSRTDASFFGATSGRSSGSSGSGSQSGSRFGSQPGSQLGSQPGSQPGSRFGSQPGSQPGSRCGSQPGSRFGSQSGSRFGSQPGSQPDTRFGSQYDMQPRSRSGSPRSSAPSAGDDFVPSDPGSLAVGMTIEHNRFGRGHIISMEGDMPNTKAVIDFASGGVKTLLLKFARIRIVEE